MNDSCSRRTGLKHDSNELSAMCADPGTSASIGRFVVALHKLQRDLETQRNMRAENARDDRQLAA